MSKVTLQTLASLTNEQSALTTIANNNTTIQTAFDNTLSRDGTTPNTMNADLDMNSNHILNLAAPVSGGDPITKTYGDTTYGAAAGFATAAAASATSSASSASASASSASSAATSASNASTSATNAATSATAAANSILALAGTSTTSLLIGTGAKTFTTQSGKLFTAGEFLQIASNANAVNYMHGTVTSYSGTSLVTNITDIGGSGTFADWNISISGTQGPTGVAGPTGPSGALGVSGTPTAGQIGVWTNATTEKGVGPGTTTTVLHGNAAGDPSYSAIVLTTDVSGVLPVSSGGTNGGAASGTLLDNISGFASTGLIKRTGAGAYSFLTDPLPIANGGTSQTVGGNAVDALLGTPSNGYIKKTAANTFTTLPEISANSYWANTNGIVPVNNIWTAAALQALTDAATILVDLSTGINFSVTLGGNRTLGAPSNTKVGQTGIFVITQDGTGSRTLAYHANYKFVGATAPTLTTTASKVDYLAYWVETSTRIWISASLNIS